MAEPRTGAEKQLTPYEVLQSGRELLEHFGLTINPIEQPSEFLEAIKQLDPRFQGGRELVRWQLESDHTEWPEETIQIIDRTAENMRMKLPETPLLGHYDAVIALGGARRSNLDRTLYPIECAKDQGAEATFNHLIVAGSARQLNEQEQLATEDYAPGAKTEFDLCAAAAAIAAKENPGLIVSLSLTNDERAGTPDVIDNVLSELQQSEVAIYDESAIAAVTTQIYQLSTELDLRRVAHKYGITDVFVAGNPSDPEIVGKRTPATYLAEIIRTLRAAALAAQAEVV